MWIFISVKTYIKKKAVATRFCMNNVIRQTYLIWGNHRRPEEECLYCSFHGPSGDCQVSPCLTSGALKTPETRRRWAGWWLLTRTHYLPSWPAGQDGEGGGRRGTGDKETSFSSLCLQSQVTENRNGKCRSKCNFLLQAVGRPRGWVGSLPWGAARLAITHQQLCTKVSLLKVKRSQRGKGWWKQ